VFSRRPEEKPPPEIFFLFSKVLISSRSKQNRGDDETVPILRQIYFKSGELVTLLVAAVFACYLVNSFSNSAAIVENEARAGAVLHSIYVEEKSAFETRGGYADFEELIGTSDRLTQLRPISLKDYVSYSSIKLASDGDYYYLLKMEYPVTQALDIVTGKAEEAPCRFHCICWPLRYTYTGERCYYVNSEGGIAASNNSFGVYDGLKGFPYDDFAAPEAAAEKLDFEGKSTWFRLEEFPGRKEDPGENGSSQK
jgi:hypothetical protein